MSLEGVPSNSKPLPVDSDEVDTRKVASADLDLMALCVYPCVRCLWSHAAFELTKECKLASRTRVTGLTALIVTLPGP